jgi:hypothetical protein
LYVGSNQGGCSNGEQLCGTGVYSDYCNYYPMRCDNPALASDNATTRSTWCPYDSPFTSDACLQSQYGGQLLIVSSRKCGIDYCSILQQDYQTVSCTDANCTQYTNHGYHVINITANITISNSTIYNGECIGTTYNATQCVNGVEVPIQQSCTYGCLSSAGCLQADINTMCVNNAVLSGLCNGNTAIQTICNNNGFGNYTQTVVCNSDQYCDSGKCFNILYSPNSTTNTTIPAPAQLSAIGTGFLFSPAGLATLIATMIATFVAYKLPTDEFKYKTWSFGLVFLAVISIGVFFSYVPAWVIAFPILALVFIGRKFIMSLFIGGK